MRRPRTRRLRLVAAGLSAAALAWTTVAGVPPTAAVTPSPGPSSSTEPEQMDSRTGALVLPTTELRAALASLAGSDAAITWDHRFGTPRSVRSAAGETLTPSYPGTPGQAARTFLSEHGDALGLSSSMVDALEQTGAHTLPGEVATVVSYAQTFGGVQATQGGSLSVVLDGDNRVVSVVGAITPDDSTLGTFGLTAGDALQKAGDAAGIDVSVSKLGARAGFAELAGVGEGVSSYVRKAAFPTADGGRLAYRVLLVESPDRAWDTVVDASTGAVLYRDSLVDHDAEGTVYENHPGAVAGGDPVIKSFGPTDESPSGWVDPSGVAGLPGPTTFGNNANSYANWSNFLVPADQGPRPVSPTSQFNYAFADNWGRSECAVPSYAQDVDPAATNLFFHHNRIHDEFYDLGFTESAGNFQVNNGSAGGSGGDPILGLVQAGAVSGGAPTYTGRDNAYMLTLPDGLPPWSGMFLWEPINDAFEGPCRDGDFDATVIEHEYAHGLSNRYVGPEDNGLNTHQSGSMGEGWGDWYALNYLHREGLADDSVVGAYATGNTERGIRNWPYDDNPTGFGDIGYDLVGPEVHADGEIWTTTLWDLRKDLVAAYGQGEGADIAGRLVTDAMPLSPSDPSMLDMRDAILQALDLRYHSRADFDELQTTVYGAFATRGMGVGAVNNVTEADPTGGNDTDPVPSFAHLDASLNGTIAGTVTNAATGKPVPNAKVVVGEYEARVSPTATTDSTGAFAIPAYAGSYPLTIQARGFGSRTLDPVAVQADATSHATYSLRPNLASEANGATIVSASGTGAANAFDDTEASSWKSPVSTGRATVKLAKPATIDTIQVSAFTSSRFEGLKSFTVQTSTNGVIWKTQPIGKDAFGFQAPRPVAPDLHYRSFRLATPVQASHIRVWTDEAQGETKTMAQVGDVQVFGQDVTGVEPLPPKPLDPDFTESFTILGSDPGGDNIGGGVTATEFANACTYPPASQGVDGWVSKLPEGFGDGAHTVTVTGSGVTWDLDLYFYDAACALVGSAASSSADESGSIPSGAAYVVTADWAGVAVDVDLVARDTQ
ncbi:MAG: M36 family metallopeptidase [Nocardioidaceae bacterium]